MSVYPDDFRVEMTLGGEYLDAVLADDPVGYWRLGDRPGYAQVILSAAPVAYWRLEEASGLTLADATGNGHTATMPSTTGVTYAADGALSNGATGLAFDKTQGGTSFTNIATGVTFSIEFWIKPQPRFDTLYHTYLSQANNYGIWLHESTMKLEFFHSAGSGASSTALVFGTWYHVVVVVSGGTVTFFVNGSSDGSFAGFTTSFNANTLFSDGTNQMVGTIDEIALYNRALDNNEISYHYRLRLSRVTTATVATAADSSGNGFNGTAVGNLVFESDGATWDGDTSALFDQTTGYVSVAHNATLAPTGSFSVESWLKTTIGGLIVGHYGTAPPFSGFLLSVGDVAAGKVSIWTGTSWFTSTATVNDGLWHHVVATFDFAASIARIYIDGALDSTSGVIASVALAGVTHALEIGRRYDGGSYDYFSGWLDEVALYASKLSDARVLAHYRAALWSDVTDDVLLDQGFRFRYGMAGGGPTDRVADTGWLRFSLNNDVTNSGHLLGYYSPLHANCRTGFTFGIEVRISFLYFGTWYYKWRGALKEIEPVPGRHRERVTRCFAVDWLNEPGTYSVRGVDLQVNATSDAVFSAVLAGIVKQPAAQSIQVGADEYAYALDDIGRGDHPSATSIFQDLMMSELGFIYQKGDTVQGGTVVFENRHSRPLTVTSSATLTDDMIDIAVPRTLERIFNRVEVTTHPKTVDAAATTVLFSLTSRPLLEAMESIEVWGDYRDPNQTLSLVGGTAMVAPVATTDYTMNSAEDGSGSDLTANFTVVATYFAASVKYVVTNNGAFSGYVTLLRSRGKGLYDYAPELSVSEDTSVQSAQGLRVLAVDMPYQESRVNGQSAADWLRSLYSVAQKQVDTVTFVANRDSNLLAWALGLEISDRIAVNETVTGVSSTGSGWFINAVEFDVQPVILGTRITCTWTLAPADGSAAWILETVGFSELDDTTFLGFL